MFKRKVADKLKKWKETYNADKILAFYSLL